MEKPKILVKRIAQSIFDKRVFYSRYTCYCGTLFICKDNVVESGRTKSCGCYQKLRAKEARTVHGHSTRKKGTSPEYRSYYSMRNRCTNKKTRDYKYYGAKGITVCERWLANFENFLEDMGPKPSKKHTIDRIDNRGNYEPSNCRWSTRKEQGNNRGYSKSSKLIKFKGVTKSLSEWSRYCKINPETISGRLNRGWSVEDALTKPPKRKI